MNSVSETIRELVEAMAKGNRQLFEEDTIDRWWKIIDREINLQRKDATNKTNRKVNKKIEEITEMLAAQKEMIF